MDAPTTMSADNGTRGDSGEGGGWFTPRKPVDDRPAEPAAARAEDRPGHAEGGAGEAPAPDQNPGQNQNPTQDRIAGQRRPLTSIRMVGAGASRGTASATGAPSGPAPSAVPWPDGSGTRVHERPADRPVAPRPDDDPARAPHDPAPRTAPYDAPSGHDDGPQRPGGRPSGGVNAAEAGSPDAVRVRRTLAEVGPVSDKVTSYFYALLFTRYPELRALFPAAMDTQRDRLLKALLTAAEHMDDPALLTEYLQHLGRGHRKYGTDASHYPAVGEALIGALSRYATSTWDEETEAAWVRTYTTISQIMIDAAAENERHAPAWWHAEVVSHDLRTPGIAIITVRPDQPYPFLAGQYTSLETPWWPRIWRHYSFASAPRSDGLLSFHVKAVPAGWVSNALVHHARPGDVLRLGPPAGSMTVDHTTDSGLLCVGGGTGIAPIKALVEDVAEHGERRPVEVFYGARTDHDLYDIDTMLRLQQSHPWLEVRAMIDGKAQLPDVVREYGPWNEYDAYLSGPVGMIRSGVDALRGVGVPYERIRHDSLEELVAAAD
ncbi:globin domain-containing protein [Streptomyces ficellus]|uniref:nitric oxide dioxygenase n=1 Tax=Streptomyces ficellus TaxID=1977088 RepID=A0A6I6F9A3_9ACTN|nr:globin domain-containing protein [Streptomyces ficellus]QGV79651.1 flavohemoprotein [Streptomyces ficellus]